MKKLSDGALEDVAQADLWHRRTHGDEFSPSNIAIEKQVTNINFPQQAFGFAFSQLCPKQKAIGHLVNKKIQRVKRVCLHFSPRPVRCLSKSY